MTNKLVNIRFDFSVEIRREVDAFLLEDKKVEAIMHLRQETGLNLKESKDIIDIWFAEEPFTNEPLESMVAGERVAPPRMEKAPLNRFIDWIKGLW